jgi:nucleoside-diphosphate-sugar epimerase
MTDKHLRILVAGLTGQLGHGIVDAARESGIELTPVVRPIGRVDAITRIRRLFPAEPSLAERTLTGDVTQPGWALSDAVRAKLLGSVDVVLNLASETNWSAPERTLHATCVLGALHGLELASALGAQQDEVSPLYCWASSLYAAGTLRGLIPEDPLPADTGRTAYEHAKWLGERALLRAAATNPATPIMIARVGGLVGDSRTGATTKRNALYMLRDTWERAPYGLIPLSPNGRVDTLPRDTAACALLRVLERTGRRRARGECEPRIVHVCAGETAPTSAMLICALRAAQLTGGKRIPRPLPLGETSLTWLSENLDRFLRMSAHRHNSVVGLRYLAIDRIFDRTNLAALTDGQLPAIGVDAIARLLLAPDVRRVSPRRGDPTLARFATV